MIGWANRAAILAALLPAPLAAHNVAVPPIFAGIPNFTLHYYDVRGRTVEEIRASVIAQQPRDPNDGERVDALAHWLIYYDWDRTGGGGCDLANATVTFGASVLMPRLLGEDTLAPELRTRWRRYITALEAHEAGHIRYAFEHIGDVKAAIAASTCDTANSAADAAIAVLVERDLEYDRATRHGLDEGVRFE